MLIYEVEFRGSSTNVNSCPYTELPEYAFTGRSNVGKSSLINMLTGRKTLARISSTPGKTVLINHFLVNGKWYLVDLPGYGYARLPHKKRDEIIKMLNQYIIFRKNLACLFVLVDCHLCPQKSDIEFIQRLGENKVPFVIIFTKADKCSATELKMNIGAFKTEMQNNWELLPEFFLSSSKDKKGKEEILNFIDKVNILFLK